MKWYYIIILSFSFLACKKANERACWKSVGDQTSVEIGLPEFNYVFLGPHLKYTLVQDTVNKIRITGGENMVGFVSAEMVNGIMTIENNNTCNFLRTYKKELEVELHFKDLVKVQFEGTKPLVCANQLQLQNIVFVIRDGAGHVDLDINANALDLVVTHGWGNFNLHGSVNYLRLEVRSNGFGDSYDMSVNDSLHVITSSQDDVKVNCDGAFMRAEIIEDGDIWYKGIPTSLQSTIYGGGELIDNN